jgi:hypothetical protein
MKIKLYLDLNNSNQIRKFQFLKKINPILNRFDIIHPHKNLACNYKKEDFLYFFSIVDKSHLYCILNIFYHSKLLFIGFYEKKNLE